MLKKSKIPRNFFKGSGNSWPFFSSNIRYPRIISISRLTFFSYTLLSMYRGSPTSTVSTCTISTSTNFIAIGIKLVLVELLCSKVSTSGNWLCSIHYLSMRVLLVARSKTLEFSSALCFLCRKRAFIRNFDFRSR